MSLPSRRPSPQGRAAVLAVPLLALVVGLLAAPALTGGAQARPRAATSVRSEAAVVDSVAWLERRVGDSTHLVNAPSRRAKVRVVLPARSPQSGKAGKKATGKRVRWVTRSVPGPAYPSLSVDVAMALRRLDPGDGTRLAMVKALQAPSRRYVHYREGELQGRYAEATARMVYLAATSGLRLSSYADGRLRRSLAGMIYQVERSPQRGRVMDSGWGGDTSDTISQAWAVQALAAVHSRSLPIVARFLARQACPAGHFRPMLDSADYTCKGSTEMRNRISSVDSTAMAILALRAARSQGVRHLGDEIVAASRWLARQVGPNGGVAEDEGQPVNARSTALAAIALKATGRLGPAGNAATWLLRHQVDDRMIKHHPVLRGQRGAIAWSRRALVRAQRVGITRATRKSWVQSTSLAAPGLTALLPERTLGVSATRWHRKLLVRLSGLAVGERYALERDGKVVASGTAGARGRVQVVLRATRRTTRLVAFGNRKGRAGVTVVSSR
ncbi:hypothetical protein [Nocardioides marmoribigeumensis]|uniref:Uncharacterized protein n=1 Tax=Nocardioides marmoribigeumensis TaxID=433649 RepID=A0ABU2C0S7_9ACTN|nr:hypothetical protein [Nocardioides marmoribigeumensis]MDR7364266.1 hypothetical protein [Nocardioides marmoribigeumensis]